MLTLIPKSLVFVRFQKNWRVFPDPGEGKPGRKTREAQKEVVQIVFGNHEVQVQCQVVESKTLGCLLTTIYNIYIYICFFSGKCIYKSLDLSSSIWKSLFP